MPSVGWWVPRKGCWPTGPSELNTARRTRSGRGDGLGRLPLRPGGAPVDPADANSTIAVGMHHWTLSAAYHASLERPEAP